MGLRWGNWGQGNGGRRVTKQSMSEHARSTPVILHTKHKIYDINIFLKKIKSKVIFGPLSLCDSDTDSVSGAGRSSLDLNSSRL